MDEHLNDAELQELARASATTKRKKNPSEIWNNLFTKRFYGANNNEKSSAEIAKEVAASIGVDPYMLLGLATMETHGMQERYRDPKSPNYKDGWMQIIPGTAAGINRTISKQERINNGLVVRPDGSLDRNDPKTAMYMAAKYVKTDILPSIERLKKVNPGFKDWVDQDGNMEKAIGYSYNAGPGAFRGAVRSGAHWKFDTNKTHDATAYGKSMSNSARYYKLRDERYGDKSQGEIDPIIPKDAPRPTAEQSLAMWGPDSQPLTIMQRENQRKLSRNPITPAPAPTPNIRPNFNQAIIGKAYAGTSPNMSYTPVPLPPSVSGVEYVEIQ